MLKEKDNRVQGNGGCNTFFGSYTLSEGSRIKFSDMASTMMACPGQAAEHDFLRVFEEADNYSLYGDTLTLNEFSGVPLPLPLKRRAEKAGCNIRVFDNLEIKHPEAYEVGA